ncbi:UAA transporter, partial [Ochromonadaceae sp. CCMP2298]
MRRDTHAPSKGVFQTMSAFAALPQELRLAAYVAGLYVTFMYWGYLQEKITSSSYEGAEEQLRWNYPFALNLCMALCTCLTASVIEFLFERNKPLSPMLFWKPALSACLASPIGYESLKYITYPLMILTKSSKPVPIMAVGMLFYKRRYRWYKYASVALLCAGICLFTSGGSGSSGKGSGSGRSSHSAAGDVADSAGKHGVDGAGAVAGAGGGFLAVWGVLLVLANLGMDGYTSNEQDQLFAVHTASSAQMMKFQNLWQCVFQAAYLCAGWLISTAMQTLRLLASMLTRGRAGAPAGGSQLGLAVAMLWSCPALRTDVIAFCLCASVGQVLIFSLVREFGSLVWVTVSVTRQLFTIVLSVALFGHRVTFSQWLGVCLVFAGLGGEMLMEQA